MLRIESSASWIISVKCLLMYLCNTVFACPKKWTVKIAKNKKIQWNHLKSPKCWPVIIFFGCQKIFSHITVFQHKKPTSPPPKTEKVAALSEKFSHSVSQSKMASPTKPKQPIKEADASPSVTQSPSSSQKWVDIWHVIVYIPPTCWNSPLHLIKFLTKQTIVGKFGMVFQNRKKNQESWNCGKKCNEEWPLWIKSPKLTK